MTEVTQDYKRGPRTLGSEGIGLRSGKKYHGPITSDPEDNPIYQKNQLIRFESLLKEAIKEGNKDKIKRFTEWVQHYQKKLGLGKGKGWHGDPEGHKQAALKGKTSERREKGKLQKEILLLKTDKLKREIELILSADEYAMARFGRTTPYPSYEEYLKKERKRLGLDLVPVVSRIDSKTIGEWISCCMHKHGPKGDGTMTHQQCIAAAHQALGKSKKDFKLTPVITQILRTDNIPFSEFKELKTDFENSDFVIFHGPIARDGPYDYEDENGNIKTLYKDIDNLKDIYSRYNYLPMKTSEIQGAHYAEEFGYATNFSVNEGTNEIEADLILVNDDNFKKILSKKASYHVSPGYNDIVKGDIQMITDVDHIALALGDEIGRACTGTNSKGASCTEVIKTHDQNLNEVVSN